MGYGVGRFAPETDPSGWWDALAAPGSAWFDADLINTTDNYVPDDDDFVLLLTGGHMRYEKHELQVATAAGSGEPRQIATLAAVTVHLHSPDEVTGSFQIEARIGGGDTEWFAVGEPVSATGAQVSVAVRLPGTFEEVRIRTVSYQSGSPAAHAAGFNVT